jgi:hypothetical protein
MGTQARNVRPKFPQLSPLQHFIPCLCSHHSFFQDELLVVPSGHEAAILPLTAHDFWVQFL